MSKLSVIELGGKRYDLVLTKAALRLAESQLEHFTVHGMIARIAKKGMILDDAYALIWAAIAINDNTLLWKPFVKMMDEQTEYNVNKILTFALTAMNQAMGVKVESDGDEPPEVEEVKKK